MANTSPKPSRHQVLFSKKKKFLMHYSDIGTDSFVLSQTSTKPASYHYSPVRKNMSIRRHQILFHFCTKSAPFHLGPCHPPHFQTRETTPSRVHCSRRATTNLSLLLSCGQHRSPFRPSVMDIIVTTALSPGTGEQQARLETS